MSYLELARRFIGEATAPAAAESSALDAAPITETREFLGAVLIASPKFGEVWIALEPSMAPKLEAEERARQDPRPVLLAEDVARLREKSEAAIQATLEVLRAFPRARVTS